MAIARVTVNNRYGIHCRPSAIIVKEMATFPGVTFELEKDGGEGPVIIDGVFSLMSMGIEDQSTVTVKTVGPNDTAACDRIAELIGYNFDFER
jgi:phosphotransferase system HPr (HPr) family protein